LFIPETPPKPIDAILVAVRKQATRPRLVGHPHENKSDEQIDILLTTQDVTWNREIRWMPFVDILFASRRSRVSLQFSYWLNIPTRLGAKIDAGSDTSLAW
jgi:hypothetical protein